MTRSIARFEPIATRPVVKFVLTETMCRQITSVQLPGGENFIRLKIKIKRFSPVYLFLFRPEGFPLRSRSVSSSKFVTYAANHWLYEGKQLQDPVTLEGPENPGYDTHVGQLPGLVAEWVPDEKPNAGIPEWSDSNRIVRFPEMTWGKKM